MILFRVLGTEKSRLCVGYLARHRQGARGRPVTLAGDNRAAERPGGGWMNERRDAKDPICGLAHYIGIGPRAWREPDLARRAPTNGKREGSSSGDRAPMSFEYLVDRLSCVLYRVVGAGNNGVRAADLRGDGIRDVLKPWDHPRGQHQDWESS